jgi:hypothetical protein
MTLFAVMERHMTRKRPAVFIIGATLALTTASADAGPCTVDIANFENTVRNSAKNLDAGPTGPQSIGAQLGHQPTPSSVKHAEKRAQTRFKTALARAKTLDAQGKRSECTKALRDAELMFDAY